jgi:hypothetical protein
MPLVRNVSRRGDLQREGQYLTSTMNFSCTEVNIGWTVRIPYTYSGTFTTRLLLA